MTQAMVAEELDIPRGSYAPLESGAYLPTEEMLTELTHILKCKDVEIYSGVYLEIIKMESANV